MKVLIADDEHDIADAIGIILKYSGYESDVVYDGEAALNAANTNVYDCMVLDIMMPKMTGLEVISTLRAKGDSTPILLLTAKAEVSDRINGLNIGADDYLPKPFDKGELVARLNVMTRRNNQYNNANITIGNTCLNTESLEITNISHSLRLSGKEVELLSQFMKNSEKWLDEDFLIDKAWDEGEYTTGAISLYIGYLINKLNAIHSNLTITSEGKRYRLTQK